MPSFEHTPRLSLPMLAAGQAQKEVTHNEALAILDLVIAATVESVGDDSPPAAPAIGQAWIVGADPEAAWAGQAHRLAGWTAGGWRFADLPIGAWVRHAATGAVWRRGTSAWQAPVAVSAPGGGSVVDIEARAAINQLIVALTDHGFISS